MLKTLLTHSGDVGPIINFGKSFFTGVRGFYQKQRGDKSRLRKAYLWWREHVLGFSDLCAFPFWEIRFCIYIPLYSTFAALWQYYSILHSFRSSHVCARLTVAKRKRFRGFWCKTPRKLTRYRDHVTCPNIVKQILKFVIINTLQFI